MAGVEAETEMPVRTCERCGKVRGVEYFPRDPLSPTGVGDACLDCHYDRGAYKLRLERKARRYLRIGRESAAEKRFMLLFAAAILARRDPSGGNTDGTRAGARGDAGPPNIPIKGGGK